MKYGILNDDT